MSLIRKLWRYLVAFSRELSDQAAYERHLRANGRPHSIVEWKRFIDERHRRKYQQGKCC